MSETSELFSKRLPPMLSYAQQAEDVVLRRAFPEVNDGFYVDLGAAWPVDDSVTKYFYEKGWSGINVEPQPELFSKLKEDRPRDVNLQVAVGSQIGRTTLKIYPEVVGWSSANKSTQEMHETAGLGAIDLEVEMMPLEKILDKHAVSKKINFLKIDVEGDEQVALESVNLEKWLPDIIVVESTIPGSPQQAYGWEPILLAAGYSLGLFDGLNRFYAHDKGLCERISIPANTFDQYIPYRWWRLLSRAAQLEYKQNYKKGVLGDNFPLNKSDV